MVVRRRLGARRPFGPLVALSVSLALAPLAGAQSFDPIALRYARPYSLLFLRFEPWPRPLAGGGQRWDLDLHAANSLTFVPNTLVRPLAEEDIEADRLSVRYARGLGRGLQASGEATLEDLGPGVLDPLIRWYHGTFLRLHDLRDAVPNGGHVVFSPAGGPSRGGWGLGDASLFLTARVDARTSISAGLKLPLGAPSELLGSGRFDAGIAAQTFVPLGRKFGASFTVGVVAQGAASRLTGTRPWVAQGAFSLVWSPNSRDSWIVQGSYEGSAIRVGLEQLDKPQASSAFGYRRRIGRGQSVTAYFTEDIDLLNPNFPTGTNVGPDFGIGVGWSLSR